MVMTKIACLQAPFFAMYKTSPSPRALSPWSYSVSVSTVALIHFLRERDGQLREVSAQGALDD
jgi:hypothetical protein